MSLPRFGGRARRMGGFRFGPGRAVSRAGSRPSRTKKDWWVSSTTTAISITAPGDTRAIVASSTLWGAQGWDEPVIIRVLGEVTIWSEDDDAADAATMVAVGLQMSKRPRSANPRPLSEGFDPDFKWIEGGTIINSGAAADQIHAWGRVLKIPFDVRTALRVDEDEAEVAMCFEADPQSGSLTPLLASFRLKGLLSLGY